MAEYNKKWADLFPATIGNQNRPSAGVDNTLPYETDKFPQHIANDPVRYDKMNAVVSQAMSNDERLNEKINRTNGDLAAHNKDPKAHATGIAGNAATASKLLTPRTISLTGKAAGSTSFDGSTNASINVTSVNADTASKLSTARKINITGNATGAAEFDGSGNISINTTVNESKHAASADIAATLQTTDGSGTVENGKFYWIGKDGQPMWLWGSNTKPSETYVYNPSKFHVAAANNDGDGANIANTYLKRSGGTMTGALNFVNSTWNLVGDDSYMGDHNISGTFCIKGANGETGIALVNKANDADHARISYGGGNINFNKTIGGNITGNAGSANVGKALQVFDGSNKAINSTFHWVGQNGQPSWVWGSNDGTNQYVYNPANFRVSYANNANGAVNADKLDGLHASDLYRYIGGHGSPVLTDIFDRAGTIDLTGLSAADKAKHKTYINKQNNAIQNLWNNTTGIHAYGGDVDMANGYAHGTLKLTQNYMNFDKILVVACNDDAIWVEYRIWDTWELAHAFSSCFSFDFIGAYGLYWIFYGTKQHGTGKFAWSTDTVLSCREQNSGIIAIYGIKY